MPNKTLRSGYAEAKRITKKFAKTFYFASKFLPKDKRLASYSIYAIARITDDSVDNKNFLENDLHNSKLEEIKNKIEAAYKLDLPVDNLLAAFRETITKYNIPKQYFDELISGVELDLEKNRYESFEELYNYCYKVAGVIGLIMLKVFGFKTVEAAKYAIELGIAMQLTNILRDINEDYRRNRIYLPLNEMSNFKVTEDQIANHLLDHNLRSLLKFQIERTKNYYVSSSSGLNLIIDKRSRFVVNIMSKMYARILDKIETNKFDIFTKRAHLNEFEKINILLKTLLKSIFNEN